MRIVILGGSGMLGHQLWRHLSVEYDQVYTTIRKSKGDYHAGRLFDSPRVIEHVDATEFQQIKTTLTKIRPDFVINCIGVTKRIENSGRTVPSLYLNALLPHLLIEWASKRSTKIITFSTDCVFDGKTGNYNEKSTFTADDLYGLTKKLGEIHGPFGLTLRSSFIGPELIHKTELLEWFLGQTDTVHGFTQAIYSGLTTFELSRVVKMILDRRPDAVGLYHISSEPISKFELLKMIRDQMALNIRIIPDDHFRCDRSLNSDKFRREFGYSPPTWRKMIEELCLYLKKETL